MSIFSERLRELRQEQGMTQEALGQVIGVKNYSVYTYEKGRSYPDVAGLIAIADHFNVSIDYLVGRTDRREISR